MGMEREGECVQVRSVDRLIANYPHDHWVGCRQQQEMEKRERIVYCTALLTTITTTTTS